MNNLYNMRNKVTVSIIMLGFLFFTYTGALAQDIQFSQFYNVPLFISPAFAGSVHQPRATVHQRLQWPKLDGKYITSFASFDTYSPKYNSGFGVYALKDWQGSNTISSTEIGFQYSYELHINSQLVFRPGLQLAMISRYIDYADLRFPIQFNDEQGFFDPNNNYAGVPRKSFADISAGGVFYSKNLWLGFSTHHINTPNQSFYGDVSRLPAKFAVLGGYKFLFSNDKKKYYSDDDNEISLTPTFNYKSQGKSDQFDLGLYGVYNQFLAGGWYRGIPFKRYEHRFQNNESVVIFLGFKTAIGLKFGYSYDFTVSKLAIARTGGSHEFNLTYVFTKKLKKKKPMRRMPCPSF